MEANGPSVSNGGVGNFVSVDRMHYNQAYYDPTQNVVICYSEHENQESASATVSRENNDVSGMEVDNSYAESGSDCYFYPDTLKLKATVQRLLVQKKAAIVKKTFAGKKGTKQLRDVWNFFGDVRLFLSEADAERLQVPYFIRYSDHDESNPVMICKMFVGCYGCKALFMFDGQKNSTNTLRYHIRACSQPQKEATETVKSEKKSIAWEYFTKLGNQKAMCSFCNRVLSYKGSGGGPYNLLRHLKSLHGEHLKEHGAQYQAAEENSETVESPSSDDAPLYDPKADATQASHSNNPKKSTDRRKSVAWDFFTEVSPHKAVCNICNKVMSFKGGGPFNLIRHIRSQHKSHLKGHKDGNTLLYSALTSKKEVDTSAIHSNVSVPASKRIGFRQMSANLSEDVNRCLVALVCKNYLPFSFVESDSFKEFVNSLNSSYSLPTKKSLSTTLLDKYYAVERDKVQKELQEADYIALTIDSWTSITEESYLSLTAHFINKNTELKSFMLECLQYSKEDTVEDLKEKIEATCEEWAIKRKIVCVTTENQNAVETAIRMMGVDHVSCFAHMLNLVVMTALTDIKSTRSTIKAIVEHFKCTPSAFKKLKEMEIQLGKKAPKLVNDVTTRWNSTYDMFERVIAVKESLMTILNQDYPQLHQINDRIIDILTNANELLAIFKSVTEEISSEKKVTVSEVIILSNVLMNKCRKLVSSYSTTGEIKRMAQTLMKELEICFSKIEENKVFSVATVLDPRFKKHGFKNHFSYDQAVLDIKQMASDIDLHLTKTEMENDFINDEPSSKKSKGDSIWDDFDRNAEELSENFSAGAAGTVETDKYLQEPLLKRTLDPLKWWHEKRNIYPRLYQLVKQRMCIAASSIPSDRLFSKSGHLMSDRRNSLSGGKVSKIVFLNYNM